MKLVLIRHGKAVERCAYPDCDRQLTEEGAEVLRENYPYLCRYMEYENLELWSSPLKRADQTAKILSDICGIGEIRHFDFISSGDLEELRIEVEKAEDSKTILVVGHEPHISSWIKDISGRRVNVKKGSVCEIELLSRKPLSGRLNWYMEAGSLNSLQKQAAEDFTSEISEVLGRYSADIVGSRRAYLEYPGDMESVHKLRLSIRKYRSLLSFLKPVMKSSEYRKLQGRLCIMGSQLGYLRELDVLRQRWSEVMGGVGMDPGGSILLDALTRYRKKEEGIVRDYLADIDTAGSYDEIWSESLKALDPEAAAGLTSEGYVLATLDGWFASIEKDYKGIKKNNLKQIHRVRIKCKKYRYLSEIFSGMLEGRYEKRHMKAKWLQDSLGELCDSNRNIEAIREMIGKTENKSLESEIELFIKSEKRRAKKHFREIAKEKKL